MPEFKHILYTLSRSVKHLIQDLRSSLEISLQHNTTQTSHQYPVDNNRRRYNNNSKDNKEYNSNAHRLNFIDQIY